MRTDDPIILKRLEQIEAACAGLRMACGFPELHAVTSRQEGRRAITIAQARTIAVREWDNYPDKTVLVDELVDRGLPLPLAVRLIREMAHSRRTSKVAAEWLAADSGATATPGQHTCEPCGTSYPSHKHLLTHRAEDHAGGTDPYNITQEVA